MEAVFDCICLATQVETPPDGSRVDPRPKTEFMLQEANTKVRGQRGKDSEEPGCDTGASTFSHLAFLGFFSRYKMNSRPEEENPAESGGRKPLKCNKVIEEVAFDLCC